MENFDMLRSEAGTDKNIFKMLGTSFEEVANLPIDYLNLRADAYDILKRKKVHKNGKMVAQFTTMGDLVNYGYTKLDRLVDDSRYCNNAVEILQDTQEKLARFALKLKDTEFTVYDVRVDRLALSAEARRWVNLQGITELRNLYNMNDNVIKDKLKGSKDGGRIYDSINAALKQFGVNIDRNEERVMEKSVSQHTTSAAIEQKAKRQSAGKMFPSIKASIRIYRENSAGSEK